MYTVVVWPMQEYLSMNLCIQQVTFITILCAHGSSLQANKYILQQVFSLFLFIGYYHEQSRADRDKYVTINWDNIPNDPGARFQFEKCGHCDSQNGPYDFNSIMHYGPKDWSINGQNTIDSKTGDSFGPGNGFSEQDLKDINDFYCGMLTPSNLSLTSYSMPSF